MMETFIDQGSRAQVPVYYYPTNADNINEWKSKNVIWSISSKASYSNGYIQLVIQDVDQ